MYQIQIDEEVLNEIIFKLRESDNIKLSNELIDCIDTDYEPKYVEESEDYTTDEDEDITYAIDDEGFHSLD